MKSYQVTHYQGELLGPVDWSFDFVKDFENNYNCGTKEQHEAEYNKRMDMLHALDKDYKKYQATTDGQGWYFRDVLAVGMYDGWPYWKPMPSVMIQSALGGGEWHSYKNIAHIREKE